MRKHVSSVIEYELYEKIRSEAFNENRTVSTIIKMILEEYYKPHEVM